jgi:LysM repeat protein
MRKKLFLGLVVLMIGLMMSGCELSASTPPPDSKTGDDAGATSDGGSLEEIIAAQGTSQAQTQAALSDSGGGDDPGSATSTPVVAAVDTPGGPVAVVTATPTATLLVQPTPEMVVPDTYTLRKGEHPYCLGRRFNIDVNAILSANGLSKTGIYTEGLVLTIPKDAAPFKGERALHPHPTDYTVLTGDTFYKIACYFGDVYPEEIAAANGMSLSDALTPGTVLSIP